MTQEQHQERHLQLHKSLDELAADWLQHQPLNSDKRFSNTTIMELMQWSHQQTIDPVSFKTND